MFKGLTVKVIIPALNEAKSIALVLKEIPDWVDEVIVADNASTDATAQVAQHAGATVVHEPRRGYGQACLAGMAAIDFCDVVVFLDADYSDYPQEMAKLLEPIAQDQADMVIGARVAARREAKAFTLPQRFGTALACYLMRLFWRAPYTDMGPFRAIRFSSLRTLRMTDSTYGWTIEMQIEALVVGMHVAQVPVSYRQRIGKSKISGTIRGVFGAGTKILATIAKYLLLPPQLSTAKRDRLIIFTRYPLPNRTKTRLIPSLGPLGAAELQRRMIEQTLKKARSLSSNKQIDIEIRYLGPNRRLMRRWLGPGLIFRAQRAGDLGQRMEAAFCEAFDSGCRRVLLIGTDVPDCSDQILQQAFSALRSHDLVLGPTNDGGYWLIGLRKEAKMFTNISWGTDAVLDQTLARASQLQLSSQLLEPLTDIDCPQDLPLLKPGLEPESPLISVIIPALNEAQNIEAAIRSAQTDGVEIIVVDGGSSDDTAKRAQALGARLIVSPPGRARQMNSGARLAKGKWLFFLHADSILPPGYAANVFFAFFDQQTVAGAFSLKSDVPSPGLSIINWLVHIRTKYFQMPYGDQALFVRKSVFQSLGGFPDVPVAEDLLFVQRLRRLGRIVAMPAAVITSARRWHRVGILRALLINQIIVAGYCLSLPPDLLARLYKIGYVRDRK